MTKAVPPDSLDVARLDAAVVREIALIRASDGVDERSVKFYDDDVTGGACIAFDMETEALVESGGGHGILDVEPFLMLWPSWSDIGRRAPMVLSGRESFPQDIGHVTPLRDRPLVSLCLTRAGLQPIYDRWGIEGVLTRLRTWLRDAKTGGLMRDGWEPVLLSSSPREPIAGIFEAGKFQELAAARQSQGAGAATGVARIGGTDRSPYLILNDATPYAANDKDQNSSLFKAINGANDNVGGAKNVPWLFLWSNPASPIEKPIFGNWETEADVRQGLCAAGLENKFDAALGELLTKSGCKFQNFTGKRVVVIVVGIWRPQAVLPGIFGLSEDTKTARRLELKAYWMTAPYNGDFLGEQCKVLPVVADPASTPELLRFTSGTAAVAPIVLIGAGALGSAMGEHLLRAGVENILVVDNDRLRPHNLARHGGRIADLYDDKVLILQKIGRDVSVKSSVAGLVADVAGLDDEQLKAHFGDARLIVDASADERVRGRLAEFIPADGQQIVRTEIYNRGRLGVQFSTGVGNNPNLLDLYYLLCREALEHDDLADWLRAVHLGGADSEELLFGFGCASASTRMPGWVVAQHAAAFMPTITEGMDSRLVSGIGLNTLDENRRPTGWRWFDVPPMSVYVSNQAPGWAVGITPRVLEFIRKERTAALPNETGGYLYGGWDAALKRIVVVEATGLPPGSNASPTNLELGPAGQSKKEQRIRHRTLGRIELCGTWHSHPNGSARMSPRDRKTIAACRNVDALRGVPTLLLIAADGDEQVHLQA
ncbi:MAG TPA: hypothetical protein HPQ04_04475 [Rhodospirillaceae bacterium]|nr:hypothetical protein [Rhodospirillaceae bacterium]